MDYVLRIPDIWRTIAGFCEVIPMIRLSSTCKWLRDRLNDNRIAKYRGLPVNVGVTRAAAAGDMSLVTMYERKATDLSWALYTAARHNQLNAIAHLRPLTVHKLDTRMWVNQSGIQSMLIQMGIRVRAWQERRIPIIMTTAEVDKFRWISTRSGVYGDMEYIKALCDNGYSFYPAVQEAALHGHLEVIQLFFVNQNKYKHDRYFCITRAARGGHMNILEWLVDKSIPAYEFPSEVCYWASWNGRVDILEFALAHGATLNYEVCINAVVRGHLDILIIALAHGAPPRFGRLRRIARRRHQSEILCYLQGK